jgi:hypothetical protein
MDDIEKINDLKKELEEEQALVQFYESRAYLILDRRLTKEIEEFRRILYNNGKASTTKREELNMPAARVEIKVREEFLKLFRESLARYNRVSSDLKELGVN